MEFFGVESQTSLRRNVLSGQERRLTVYSQQAMNWFDPHRGSIDRKNIHNCFLDTGETNIYSSQVQNNWKIKIKLRHDATNIDQLSHHKLLGLIIGKHA